MNLATLKQSKVTKAHTSLSKILHPHQREDFGSRQIYMVVSAEVPGLEPTPRHKFTTSTIRLLGPRVSEY
ncbi:hypothetical protein TNCV_4724921 [Trichonephila clavipes]|uniref:Uncharacterized protein n=1 Tax=Trichonephila clavipes TaxID=2585209 RepID=A0A8X6W723_TRICX|nr:hypothetical protein TNCV_4724921 [Trichonephila clavipes]